MGLTSTEVRRTDPSYHVAATLTERAPFLGLSHGLGPWSNLSQVQMQQPGGREQRMQK